VLSSHDKMTAPHSGVRRDSPPSIQVAHFFRPANAQPTISQIQFLQHLPPPQPRHTRSIRNAREPDGSSFGSKVNERGANPQSETTTSGLPRCVAPGSISVVLSQN
jgi:hypothetical protein